MVVWCAAFAAAENVPWRFSHAYSMLTHDGRRLVSHVEGTNTVYELVPTNRLPANLPPVWEWTLYAVKSAHTDIGLHNSQYIQRHGTVRRLDEASRLVAADPDDSDPGAFRYVAEGAWFWGNYPQDRGEVAAMALVTNEMARGRLDVGASCAGRAQSRCSSGGRLRRAARVCSCGRVRTTDAEASHSASSPHGTR